MADRPQIKISYAESKAKANSMLLDAGEMKSALDAAAKEILSTESAWGGNSGAKIRSGISQLQGTFASFETAVINYADFITNTATAWEEADAAAGAAGSGLTTNFTNLE